MAKTRRETREDVIESFSAAGAGGEVRRGYVVNCILD